MRRVRIELVADFGPRRGQTFSGMVVEAEYEAVMRAALNKLNLKKNKRDLHLVLRDRYQGTRVLSPDCNLEVLLRDGATIVLTTEKPCVHVPKPPRSPWPGSCPGANHEDLDTFEEDASGIPDGQDEAVLCTKSASLEAMTSLSLPLTSNEEPLGETLGHWAILQGNILPLVRQSIAKTTGFIEKCMGSYIAFDYHANAASQLADMFPDPQHLPRKNNSRLLASVRRECRGLLVCASTGRVLARRLPKFFNVDEVEETRFDKLPGDGGFATQKLDGSLVSPFPLHGQVRWAGKAAIVPAVEDYVKRTSFETIAAEVLGQGCTPLFEWCEAGPPVGVIAHIESSLTLIAVRDNITGDFWDDERLRALGCKVVDVVPFDDLSSLLHETRLLTGMEGVVVRWPQSSHMVKLKSSWWMSLSASQKKAKGEPARALLEALQSMPLTSVPPPMIWQAVLDGNDDQMSLVFGHLTPETECNLREFARATYEGLRILHQELCEWAECAHEASEADLAKVAGGWPPKLLAAYQRRSPCAERELRKFLRRIAAHGQMLALEALIGACWNGTKQSAEECQHMETSGSSVPPLRDDQIVDPASDAAVLVELDGGHAAGHGREQPKSCRNASIEYLGVFLSPDARKKLLRHVPPRFSHVEAEHMTLVWMPQTIKDLSVGTAVKLEVTGIGLDDNIQAVSVVTNEMQPRHGHITISLREDGAVVETQGIKFDPIAPVIIDGVVGVGICLGGVDAETLPPQILDRVTSLTEGQPGQSETFENITDSQRYALHLLADEMGLEHRSEGKKDSPFRKLILTVPKRGKKKLAKNRTQLERTVVKDARKFAAIFGDVPGLQVHGHVTRNGVVWQPGALLPGAFERLVTNSDQRLWSEKDRVVVIMRGFPGSGKSSVAAWLRKQASLVQASADDYFTDAAHVQDAHDSCRKRFMEALHAQQSVIVDNTNVRKSDYAFYKDTAQREGYEVTVLELVCESTVELERFRKRSLHGVPGGAVGSMWARWEQDPCALRLAPYEAQDLMAWLRAHGMYDRPPHTHLMMPSGPFLSVPPASRAQFHELFSHEWGRHYISEIGRPDGFQLFFDIDGLDFDKLLSALPKLLLLLDGANLVISGVEGPPPGYHIFVVGKMVDSSTAMLLRQQWMDAAPELGDHVDGQLYRNPQLRLLGSRKNTKDGIDVGRVHAPLGNFNAEGWHAGTAWEWHQMSIHG